MQYKIIKGAMNDEMKNQNDHTNAGQKLMI